MPGTLTYSPFADGYVNIAENSRIAAYEIRGLADNTTYSLNSYDSAGGLIRSGGVTTDANGFVSAGFAPSNFSSYGEVRLVVVDRATNEPVTNSVSAIYDLEAPTTTITSLFFSADSGVSSTDFITNQQIQTFVGHLSESLNEGEFVQVSLDGGSNWVSTASDVTAWSLAGITLAGSGALSVRVTDTAGNSNQTYNQSYIYDSSPPTLAITTSVSTLKAGETATITFTFSEDPGATFTWNGAVNDVSVSGGTLSAISGTGLTRIATFTPDANVYSGTASITVPSGVYTDTAGNAGDAGSTPSLTFDTLAPAVESIVRAGGASGGVASSATSVQYTVTFSESVSGVDASDFTLSASGNANGSIAAVTGSGTTWTVNVNNLTGNGTLRLDLNNSGTGVTDGAGNVVSGFTAGQAYTLDHTPPAAPSTPDMTSGTDTGQSSTDNITANNTPVFTGTAESGSTVTLYDFNGTTVLGTTTADGGNWSITSSTLSDGAHTLTAKATDAAGNISNASSGLNITIDTVAPNAPTVASIPATNDTTPEISGTAEANATVYVYEGNALIGTSTANAAGQWILPGTTISLGEGEHAITARVLDAAGNTSDASVAATVTVDTMAPTATIGQISLSDDTGASSTDFITNTPAQVISGELSANLASGEHVDVSLDNGATWTAATTNGTAWSLNVTLPASGTVVARVVDAAGNAGSSTSHDHVVDRVAPTNTVTSLSLSLDSGESSTDLVTRFADQVISGSLSEALAPGDQVQISLDNGATFVSATAAVGETTWSQSVVLSGSGTLQVRVLDVAGNSGTAYSKAYVLDTEAPARPSMPILDADSDSGNASGDNITSDDTPTFSGTAETGSRVTLYDGETEIGSGIAVGGNWQITSSPLADGNHTIAARATDLAGNQSTAGTSQPIIIDTTVAAPTFVLVEDTGVSTSDGVTSNGLVNVLGLETGATWEVSYNSGQTWQAASGTSFFVSEGEYATGQIQVRQTDAAGNLSDAALARNITVDTGDPTVEIAFGDTALSLSDRVSDVTFTFSQEPVGFDVSHLTVTGGLLSGLAVSSDDPLVWTATFTANDGFRGTGSISVNAGGFEDLAGNPGGEDLATIGINTVVVTPPTNPNVPTTGPDVLTGTAAADVISAGLGNDSVSGGQGTDTLFGNQGNDILYGNQGNDQLFGGQDSDQVFGGQDDDYIEGNKGNDHVEGNKGNDIVLGNEGDDVVLGNEGDDWVHGGQGSDWVHGGQGSDYVFGGLGNDTVNGGAGDDVLEGGAGADIFVFARNQGRDVVTDFSFEEGDRLDLQGQLYELSATTDGYAQLTLEDGGIVVLQGVTEDQFADNYLVA